MDRLEVIEYIVQYCPDPAQYDQILAKALQIPDAKRRDILFECIADPSQLLTLDDFDVFHMKTFAEEMAKEQRELAFIDNPLQQKEGVLECPRCKCTSISIATKQTRRGDEATSVFAACTKCKYRWTAN